MGDHPCFTNQARQLASAVISVPPSTPITSHTNPLTHVPSASFTLPALRERMTRTFGERHTDAKNRLLQALRDWDQRAKRADKPLGKDG